jgi:hypothetical protein
MPLRLPAVAGVAVLPVIGVLSWDATLLTMIPYRQPALNLHPKIGCKPSFPQCV